MVVDGYRDSGCESNFFFLAKGLSKIILILTKGILVNYANLRAICEIFPIYNYISLPSGVAASVGDHEHSNGGGKFR